MSPAASRHANKQRGMSDDVNHPQHYADRVPGIECIDVVEHFDFNRGNAIKCIWRAGLKGDTAQEIQDLRKSAWYATRAADKLEKENGGA